MILTPIDPDALDTVLARYEAGLSDAPALRVFQRIAASRAAPGDEASWHRDAVDLAARFGMNPVAEPPQAAYSWDGAQVRVISESAVLMHEIAHYQLASPARRARLDFGLGAGPETGFSDTAEQARIADEATRESEEQQASLLGVLWQIELGQPGIEAFQEQNWLEGAGRPSAARFFVETLTRLIDRDLVDTDGRPLMALRITADR